MTRVWLTRNDRADLILLAFISSFSPHLTKEVIQSVMQQPTQARIYERLSGVELPVY